MPKNPKRREKWIWYPELCGVIGAAGVSVSAHTGAAVQQEISTFGLVGLLLDTAGDMVNGIVRIPRDLNYDHDIGVRVVYQTASATAADTIDWIVLYDVIAEGTAVAVGATALDTAIAQDTVTGTAQALELSPRGVIDGSTITAANLTGGACMVFNIEMDAFAAGLTEDKIFLGLALDYVPKDYLGSPLAFNPGLGEEA